MKLKYCPNDASVLIYAEDEKVLTCSKCGLKLFQNSKPTVSAVISDDQNRVLLAKRKSECRNGLWGAPGGFLENGEELIDGLKREVREEVGVEVEVLGLVFCMVEDEPYPKSSFENSHVINFQFKCKVISGEPKSLHETSEVRWFSKDEIPWDQIAFPGVKGALRIFFGIDKPYLPK